MTGKRVVEGEPRYRFPTRALALAGALTAALVVAGGWTAWRLHADMNGFVATELQLRADTSRIMHLDEVLTMSARMAAATGDPQWESRYHRYEPELDRLIKGVMAHAPEAYLGASAAATDEANRRLVAMEGRAFDLVRAGRKEEAVGILFSGEYEAQKAIYARGMEESNRIVWQRVDNLLTRQGVRLQAVGAGTLALLVVLAMVWMRIVFLIQRYLAATRAAELALAEVNANLERRVSERTADLFATNERLLREMEHRARVETELRHAQRLEAVGRLASGIAHEINTPIQFVNDSIQFIREAVRDTIPVIDKYVSLRRAAASGKLSAEMIADVADAELAADLPYLMENVPKAVDRSLDGLDRVSILVRSMKEFAHVDQSEQSPADINRALDTTLTIARNEYKHVADLETDLRELPPVVCRISELNQVFLNIIVNAAHAIADVVKGSERKGRIAVATRQEGEDVVISISDTGGGIPENIRDKIFDPFFTTKEVGRGSGQGLAISRSVVVDKHGGELTFEAEVGAGTTFFIRLPIHGLPKRVEAPELSRAKPVADHLSGLESVTVH